MPLIVFYSDVIMLRQIISHMHVTFKAESINAFVAFY